MTEPADLGVVEGPDGVPRCRWCLGAPEYIAYHDEVWGRPMHGDRELFEMLTLELFQSGLSFLTILRKHDNFTRAFEGWDIERIAGFSSEEVERLLGDDGIVRHRAKIEAVVANAGAVVALWAEGSTLDELAWSFAPSPRAVPPRRGELTPSTAESKAMSKELKRRGFAFVGPTTAYSLMQAAGLVDDHLAGCGFRGAGGGGSGGA